MRTFRLAASASALARICACTSLLVGCSSVGSSVVRTGPALAPNAGPVALYAAGALPQGTSLGAIEVHGANQDSAIDDLVPEVVKRVQELGGDAAVIDDVSAGFEILLTTRFETYSYACGFHSLCTGTRTYPARNEVMTVVIHAHAVRMARTANAGGAS